LLDEETAKAEPEAKATRPSAVSSKVISALAFISPPSRLR
jgi:hypothetical protein